MDRDYEKSMELLVENLLDRFQISLVSETLDNTWYIPTYWLPSVRAEFFKQLLNKGYFKMTPKISISDYLSSRVNIPLNCVVKLAADFVFQQSRKKNSATT